MENQGGITVVPDPPVTGQEVEVTVSNGASELWWRIPPGDEMHVEIEDGVARFVVPASASGKDLVLLAGERPNVANATFSVVSSSSSSNQL